MANCEELPTERVLTKGDALGRFPQMEASERNWVLGKGSEEAGFGPRNSGYDTAPGRPGRGAPPFPGCTYTSKEKDKSVIYPWTARRSNQSILKEINLVYSLEGLMLKLKL